MFKFFTYLFTMVVTFMSSSVEIEASHLTRFVKLPNVGDMRIIFATLGVREFAENTNMINIANSYLTFSELKEKLNDAYENFKDSLNQQQLNEKDIKYKVNDARLKQTAILRALLEDNPQFLQELIDSQVLLQDHKVIFPDKEDLFILLRQKQHIFFMSKEEIIKIIASSNLTSVQVFELFSSAYYHHVAHNKDFIKKSFYNQEYKHMRCSIEEMQDGLIGTLGYELQLFFYKLFSKDRIAKKELINTGRLPKETSFYGDTGLKLKKDDNFHYEIIKKIVCE